MITARQLIESLVQEKLTHGIKRAYERIGGHRKCESCNYTVPRYPGRYPANCPECGDPFVVKESVTEVSWDFLQKMRSIASSHNAEMTAKFDSVIFSCESYAAAIQLEEYLRLKFSSFYYIERDGQQVQVFGEDW